MKYKLKDIFGTPIFLSDPMMPADFNYTICVFERIEDSTLDEIIMSNDKYTFRMYAHETTKISGFIQADYPEYFL